MKKPEKTNPPMRMSVVIEAAKGTKVRYNVSGDYPVVESILFSSMTYPYDYGYIPKTRADGGTPMPVMILSDAPTMPGCVIEAIPVTVLKLTENKIRKDIILAKMSVDNAQSKTNDRDDIPDPVLDEIEDFVINCQKPKDTKIELIGWDTRSEAQGMITHAIKMYKIKK